MTSEGTRQEVWQELLDVERMCLYYEEVHSRATRTHVCLRATTLVLITAGVAAILDLFPWSVYAGAIAALVVVVLTVWDAVAGYSKKAAISNIVGLRFSKLRIDLRELWLEVNEDSVDDAHARAVLRKSRYQAEEAASWAGMADLTPDRKLNFKLTQDAYWLVTDRYKTESVDA